MNKISQCGILMSEIEAYRKERLHVALKRSGFFTTVCTVSTFVTLRKHKSACAFNNSNKRKTPWESQSFPLWNSQRRAGGCGFALRCVLTANDTTWKCITWHPGGSYSLGLYFYLAFFPFFVFFSPNLEQQNSSTSFGGGDKTLFCDSRRANFLSTEANC